VVAGKENGLRRIGKLLGVRQCWKNAVPSGARSPHNGTQAITPITVQYRCVADKIPDKHRPL